MIRITLPNCQHLYLQARIFVRACEAQQINQDYWDLEDLHHFEEMQASTVDVYYLHLIYEVCTYNIKLHNFTELYVCIYLYAYGVYIDICSTVLWYMWIAIPMALRNSSIVILTSWGCSAHQWRHLSRQEASWWLTQHAMLFGTQETPSTETGQLLDPTEDWRVGPLA